SPDRAVAGGAAQRRWIDAESIDEIARDQAEVELVTHAGRQRVERADADHHAPSPASARARISSSGVLTFMNTTAGSPWAAISAAAISTTRTRSKKPTILSRPARRRSSIGSRHAFPYTACIVSSWSPTRGMTTSPSAARVTTQRTQAGWADSTSRATRKTEARG